MITIVAQNTYKEGKIQEAMPLLEELIAKSRQEKGCLKYDLHEDINNPLVFTFIEEWADENAIEEHNNSSHFREIVPKLADFVADKDIRLYKKVR